MIGVLANESEHLPAEEFFQLFKTPWELFNPEQSYDVVLIVNHELPRRAQSKLFVVYSSRELQSDKSHAVRVQKTGPGFASLAGEQVPIYNEFAPVVRPGAKENHIICSYSFDDSKVVRLGYDLFAEVRHLLSRGQPRENAAIPTLDLHIQVLREVIVSNGVPLVEIAPTPPGVRFIACLTHDIDFLSLRQHMVDHTAAGFLYRATVGTLIDFLTGRRSFGKLIRNWAAVLKTPLVHLGFCRDFWQPFNAYLAAENGKPSTFFIIPFKGRAGKAVSANSNSRRATRYDIADIEPWIPALRKGGCEVALHGLDAWRDATVAREEAARIKDFTQETPAGLRMHWLYFSEESPALLDEAGFQYDSTCGFNDAAGYRAGTSQVFRPFGAKDLLELPMHIQDTALFYRDRMYLDEGAAWNLCSSLIARSRQHGGVLTVLWHDRSLVPERLWGEFYSRLLEKLEGCNVWFATAKDVVAWFKARRAVDFFTVEFRDDQASLAFKNVPTNSEHDFSVRLWWLSEDGSTQFSDTPLACRTTLNIPLASNHSSDLNRCDKSTPLYDEVRVLTT